MKDNLLAGNLFDKAIEWYMSGDKGKKAAALDLFPEDMLKREIENFKKRNKKERLLTRDEELQQVLKKAKKEFPIGTLIWSDEGTDSCPNLVVGEPYIGSTKYGSHIPYGKYENSDEEDVRRTVLVHTVRIYRSDIESDEPKWYRSIVGLENILIQMDKPLENRYPQKKSFYVNLDEYHMSEKNVKELETNHIKSKVSELTEELKKCSEKLTFWEGYDPDSLTKEKINKMVEEYKW